MSSKHEHVIVIGAGLGGLATALRLQFAGFQVTVLEKLARPGGRSNVIEEQGFRVDTGPTLLLMKDTFEETYRAVGQDLQQRLKLIQLDPHYRIYYHDGTYLDLFANMAQLAQEVERLEPGSRERLFRFLGAGAKKYELAMDFVVRNYTRITDLANPSALTRLMQTRAYENMYRQVSKYFNGSDKLAKAFTFHSMFLGLSPYDSLAMYSMITYADMALGMWFPMGGIYSVVEDMVRLGQELGFELRTNSPVQEILVESGKVSGVRLQSGEQLAAKIVISNADLPYTYRGLVNDHHRKDYSNQRLERMSYSCSGYLLYLGIDKTYPHLRHQALYFSEDYKANLEAIFTSKTIPEEPSFHLNIPTVTDPSLAPPGHTLLYILAPMPNLRANGGSPIDWDRAAPMVREKLIAQLERIVDPDLRQHIVWERQYRPTDFLSDFNASYGTAFGSLSMNFFQATYFRPHNKSHDIDGLYFVGQGTYPGIGMPMVMISSKLVTERILQEWH